MEPHRSLTKSTLIIDHHPLINIISISFTNHHPHQPQQHHHHHRHPHDSRRSCCRRSTIGPRARESTSEDTDVNASAPKSSTKSALSAGLAECRKRFAYWRDAIQKTCESFMDCSHSCDNLPVGGPGNDDRQASLLVVPPSERIQQVRVMFVHWTDPVNLIGKPISIDTNNCIVNVPNFVKSQERFAKHNIIHTAVGARMRKARDDREVVPHYPLRVKMICDTMVAPVRGLDVTEDDACFICADQPNLSEQSDTMKCMFCLTTTHRKCCGQLVNNINEFRDQENSAHSQKFRLRVPGFNLDMVPPILFTEPEAQAHQV